MSRRSKSAVAAPLLSGLLVASSGIWALARPGPGETAVEPDTRVTAIRREERASAGTTILEPWRTAYGGTAIPSLTDLVMGMAMNPLGSSVVKSGDPRAADGIEPALKTVGRPDSATRDDDMKETIDSDGSETVDAGGWNPMDARRIRSRTLASGMRLVVLEDHAMPLVAIDLWIRSGSAEDPLDAPGTAHLLEHLLFTGGDAPVDEEIENLGGVLEATTSLDASHLHATVASRHFERAVELVGGVAGPASIPVKAFRREKGIVIDELQVVYADPFRRLRDELTARTYGDHPYGRPVAGDADSVRRIAYASVVEERRRRLRPANLALVVAGDVTIERVVTALEKSSPAWARGRADGPNDASKPPSNDGKPGSNPDPAAVSRDIPAVASRNDPKDPSLADPIGPSSRRSAVVETAVAGHRAYVLAALPGPSSAQESDIVGMDIVHAHLGLGSNSRLRRVLVDRGIAERVEVDFTTRRGPSLLVVGVECAPGRIERVRQLVEEEITRLESTSLDREELESARTRLLSDFAFDTETYAGRTAVLGFYESIGRPALALRYVAEVRKATESSVHAATRRWMRPSAARWLIARPEAGTAPPVHGPPILTPLPGLSDSMANPAFVPASQDPLPATRKPLPADRGGTQTVSISPASRRAIALNGLIAGHEGLFARSVTARGIASTPVRGTVAPAGRTAEVSPARMAAVSAQSVESLTGERGEADPRKYVLPGGMTVIVKPVPRQPVLAAQLFVKHGAMHETDIPAGSTAMLARLMIRESVHPAIREQLGFYADQVGGGLSVLPADDSVSFSVVTTRERAASALDLLASIATKPRLREVDIELLRQEMRIAEEASNDTFETAIRLFERRLFPDSRLGLPMQGTLESRRAITPDLLERIWRERYRLSNMVLVVVGDVDPNAVSREVEAAFRRKIPPGPDEGAVAAPLRAAPASPPSETSGVLEFPVPLGAVVVGARAPGASDPDYPALMVLSAVLGGGKRSRLFQALRGEAGIGYDLGTWSPPRSRDGYLAGYLIAAPYRSSPEGAPEPVIEPARRIVLREIASLADGRLTEAEVVRARRFSAGETLLRRQRVAEQARMLGWWECAGAGYGKDKEIAGLVEKCSLEEVAALARRCLRSIASLTLLPETVSGGSR